ncbi:MAG: hypothetical protein KDK62_07115 [Chlamydiia bacterium]|nr:hypothetical protein [Chlamydiia bacterium]
MRSFILAFSLVSAAAIEAAPETTTTESRELKTFYNKLEEQIEIQQKRVEDIKSQIESREIIPPAAILAEFENAYIMLNIKRTLYGNFYGTPSVQSPAVREALLAIFEKTIITQGDLAQLEALVRQERPKYAGQQSQ